MTALGLYTLCLASMGILGPAKRVNMRETTSASIVEDSSSLPCTLKSHSQCLEAGSTRDWWALWRRPDQLPTSGALHCFWIGKPEKGTCVPDCGHSSNQNALSCERPFCVWEGSKCKTFMTTPGAESLQRVYDNASFPYFALSTPAGAVIDKLPCSRVGAATVAQWMMRTYKGKLFESYYLWSELARLTFNSEQMGVYGCRSCQVFDTHGKLLDNLDHARFRAFNTMEVTCRGPEECQHGSFYVRAGLLGPWESYCHPCPLECSSCSSHLATQKFKCVLRHVAGETPRGYECIEARPRASNPTEWKTFCAKKTFYVPDTGVAKLDVFGGTILDSRHRAGNPCDGSGLGITGC